MGKKKTYNFFDADAGCTVSIQEPEETKDDSLQISEKELESIIKAKLCQDPFHYLDFLRRIIDDQLGSVEYTFTDSSDVEMPYEKYLLQSPESPLIPKVLQVNTRESFVRSLPYEDLREVLDGARTYRPGCKVHPDSVDTLFNPWIRKLMKKWQRDSFDESLGVRERDRAKRNFQRIFEIMLKQKRGTRKGISGKGRQGLADYDAEGVRFDYRKVNETCKAIIRNNKYSASRTEAIKGDFPDEGDKVIDEIQGRQLESITAERLRNIVLAKRYNCSERAVEECLRGSELIARKVRKS